MFTNSIDNNPIAKRKIAVLIGIRSCLIFEMIVFFIQWHKIVHLNVYLKLLLITLNVYLCALEMINKILGPAKVVFY